MGIVALSAAWRGVRARVVEFFMVTVYNTVAECYSRAQLVYRLARMPLPLQLVAVRSASGDLTASYLKDKNFLETLGDDTVVHVDYTFDGREYSYCYTKDDPIEFPPYTVEKMRAARPARRIAALSVDGDPGVYEMVKRYAGPYHDFYGREADLAALLGRPVSKISLIDSCGQFIDVEGSVLRFNS